MAIIISTSPTATTYSTIVTDSITFVASKAFIATSILTIATITTTIATTLKYCDNLNSHSNHSPKKPY